MLICMLCLERFNRVDKLNVLYGAQDEELQQSEQVHILIVSQWLFELKTKVKDGAAPAQIQRLKLNV